jgi:hypothetical protein
LALLGGVDLFPASAISSFFDHPESVTSRLKSLPQAELQGFSETAPFK